MTLQQAVETALKNNPNIDSIMRTISQAEYLHRAAAKEWLPVISTDYSFMALTKRTEMTVKGGQISELGLAEDELTMPILDNTEFTWNVHARMPVYTGGAIKYQKEIARLGIDIAKTRFLEAKADLIQEVTIDYFNVLRAKNYWDVVVQNLTRFRKHERNAAKKYKEGLTAKNLFLEIKVRRAIAQNDLITAKRNLMFAKAVLNISIGVNVDTHFELEDIPLIDEPAFTYDECSNLAGNNNPTLVAYTFLGKRINQVKEYEKTDTRPKVHADLFFSRHGKTPVVNGDDNFTNNIFTSMIVFNWNIFDWFKASDRANAKGKEFEALISARKSTENRIALDIREAYLDIQAAKRKLKIAKREIAYAQEDYQISKQRYEEQVAASTEVNDALVLLRQARFSYYDAFYEYNVAFAKLERVTGLNLKKYLVDGEKR